MRSIQFSRHMYTLLIVTLAILIAIVQGIKEASDAREDAERELEIDSVNAELRAKTDTIERMQREANTQNLDLIEKQGQAIELQLLANKHLTGGRNKPKLVIQPLPLYIYPGHENRPREHQYKYKPVKIYITNTGDVPLRDVIVRISGHLGFDFNDDGVRDMREYPNTLKPKTGYVSSGPMTLASGQRELVFTGNYETLTTKVNYAVDILWENGFYSIFSNLESNAEYGSVLATTSERIFRGNVEIIDRNAFFEN